MKSRYFLIVTFIMLFFVCLNSKIVNGQDYKVIWNNEIILSFDRVNNPQLSPDGSKLIFIRDVESDPGNWESHLWKSNSDGSFAKDVLFTQEDIGNGRTFRVDNAYLSPDGKTIVLDTKQNLRITDLNFTSISYLTRASEYMDKSFNGFWFDGSKYFYSEGNSTYVVYLDKLKNIFIEKSFGNEIISGIFSFSPDKNIIVYKELELVFLNINGTVINKKQLSSSISLTNADPIWTPNGKYIILNNVLYVVATGEEMPFLPTNVVTLQKNGVTYIGPKEVTLSKNGKKIAFVMYYIENGDVKGSKIKVLDLNWKD